MKKNIKLHVTINIVDNTEREDYHKEEVDVETEIDADLISKVLNDEWIKFNRLNLIENISQYKENEMNIDDMKIGDIKKLMSIFGSEKTETLNRHLGQKVIIRTYSSGVWFGTLVEKSGKEVILENARRMYFWQASKSISLSAVAIEGINVEKSKIVSPVKSVWLEAIEIIELSDKCITDLAGAPYVEAE